MKKKINSSNFTLIPLGNFQDSSSQIAYQFNTIHSLGASKVKNIESISPSELKEVVIFFDDAVFSGKQLEDIVRTWTSPDYHNHEEHTKFLGAEMIEALKNRELCFVLLYYDNDKNCIETIFEKYFGTRPIVISAKKFENDLFADFPIAEHYFQEIGYKLLELRSKDENGNFRENWSDERVKKGALGYNNGKQAIVYAWNTPTFTLTALWQSSSSEKFYWKSLFTRIDKK